MTGLRLRYFASDKFAVERGAAASQAIAWLLDCTAGSLAETGQLLVAGALWWLRVVKRHDGASFLETGSVTNFVAGP